MKPDGTDAEGAGRSSSRSSTTTGRRTASGSSTPAMDGSFASELYIMPTDGSKPAGERHPLRHLQRRRDLERRQQARLHQPAPRSGMRMHVLSLQKPATTAARHAGHAGDIDWDDIHLRVDRAGRPARPMAMHLAGRPAGRLPRRTGGDDLWVASDRRRQRDTRSPPANMRRAPIRWSEGRGPIYFLDGTASSHPHRTARSAAPSGARLDRAGERSASPPR